MVERLDAVRPPDDDRLVPPVAPHHERLLHRPDHDAGRADRRELGQRVRPDRAADGLPVHLVDDDAEQEREAPEGDHLRERAQLVEPALGVALGVEAREREEEDPADHERRARQHDGPADRREPAQRGRAPQSEAQREGGSERVSEEEREDLKTSRQTRWRWERVTKGSRQMGWVTRAKVEAPRRRRKRGPRSR